MSHVVFDSDRLAEATNVLNHLRQVSPVDGWFTETYCRKSRYFTPENGARIEGIRHAIDQLDLDDELRCVALTSLMEAADRVDSTVGVQMAYLKKWAPRALQPLRLRDPEPLPRSPHGKAEVHRLEAREAAATLEADVAYLDPPYNQHPYGSNYFMLNLLCEYKPPADISNVSGIPVDWNRSRYNQRKNAEDALFEVIENCNAKFVLISYNSEGFITPQCFLDRLGALGKVTMLETPYNTFRGSRNLRQRAIHVTEFLYLLKK